MILVGSFLKMGDLQRRGEMVGESGVFGPVLASGGDRSFIPEGDLDSSPRDLLHSPPI